MVKWLMGGVGFLAALGWGAWIALDDGPLKVSSVRQDSQVSATRDDRANESERIRKLERETTALRAMLTRSLAKRAADESESIGKGPAKDDEAQARRREKLQAHAEDEKKERATVLSERLASEPREALWASKVESGVENVVSESFPDSQLTNADCKTTVCELGFEHKGTLALNNFLDNFPHKWRDFGELHYETTHGDDGSVSMVMQLVRKEAAQELNAELSSRLAWAEDSEE